MSLFSYLSVGNLQTYSKLFERMPPTHKALSFIRKEIEWTIPAIWMKPNIVKS